MRFAHYITDRCRVSAGGMDCVDDGAEGGMMAESTAETRKRMEGTSRIVAVLLFFSLWLVVLIGTGAVLILLAVAGDAVGVSDVQPVLLILMTALVAALLTRLFTQRQSKNRLRERLDEERSTSRRLDVRVDELETENERLRDEIAALEARVDELADENEQLSGEIEPLEAQVDELEDENEKLTRKYERLRQRNEALQAENEALLEELDRLRGPPAVEVESVQEQAGGRYATLRHVLDADRDLAGDIVLHPSGGRYLLPYNTTFLPGDTVVLLVPAHIDVGDTMTLVERLSLVDTDEE